VCVCVCVCVCVARARVCVCLCAGACARRWVKVIIPWPYLHQTKRDEKYTRINIEENVPDVQRVDHCKANRQRLVCPCVLMCRRNGSSSSGSHSILCGTGSETVQAMVSNVNIVRSSSCSSQHQCENASCPSSRAFLRILLALIGRELVTRGDT
jgi:hypothetical protein